MRPLLPFGASVTLLVASVFGQPAPLYLDASQPVESRVDDLFSRLTSEEKINLLSGVDSFDIRPIERLKFPRMHMSDGPAGTRNDGPTTAYPAPICLAASWDVDLAKRFGESLGRDARARGVNFLLGPAVNIHREPQNGRNFEYLGEDPCLASRIVVPIVQGVQSKGVAATVKHFACNNQETERDTISAEVDLRTLNEIYLPAFKAAVTEGHALAVMCAYNRINATYCSANDWLLNQTLKGSWAFAGVVMSDWGAVHDTLAPLNAGLDLEMPSGKFFNQKKIQPLLDSGQVLQATLDDKGKRILRVAITMGALDRPQKDESIPLDDPTSAATALQIAREGIVLLKNDHHALPLDRTKIKTIVVMGPNSHPAITGGGGSAYAKPLHAVSVLEGITSAAGKSVQVVHIPPDPDAALDVSQIQQIQSADALVICAGFNRELEKEGKDRTFALPAGQEAMIAKAVSLNSRVIVVLNAGGSVDMRSWISQAPAIVQAWYPGQAGGTALGEILFGDVNPSGKLPASFEKRFEDNPAFGHVSYPGEAGSVNYHEGIFVGYRHYDREGIVPQFCFGHGLSYTTFAFKNMSVKGASGDSMEVSADVSNTGDRAGAEIVELYVHPLQPAVLRPVRELKGFARLELQPGESKRAAITLKRDALGYFSMATDAWVIAPGKYELEIGSSSLDKTLKQTIEIGN